MFKVNSANQYIASKSQSVKPDVISDVGPNEQIRLLVPSFVGFMDPTETYLKFELQMSNARGVIVPDSKCGAHALFRNVIIRDGANQCSIESIEDYNACAGLTRPFTQQSSIMHKRELFEGVQQDANNSGASLYYDAPVDLTGATNQATAKLSERTANKVEIYMQLKAGFFGGGIVPVAAMNGLRLQIDTEDPNRALVQPFLTGSLEAGIATCHETTANLAANAVGTRDGTTAANNIGSLKVNIDSDTTGKDNPFAINDIIYLNHDTAGNGAFTNEIVAGVVQGFFIDGGKLSLRLVLQSQNTTQVPANGNYTTANNTKIYYKVADRMKAINVFSATNLTNASDVVVPAPSYTISNIEMLCQAVTPPDGYVAGMLKKAQSGEGLQIDYMTSELHRYNQVNTSGVVQIQVPTVAQRAKAIFAQPIPLTNYRNLAVSSFSGVPDNALNYQFVKGNELIPSRLVDLQRYSQVVGTSGQKKNEPLHTAELQKALVNIGSSVYSLHKIADNFSIARSFNKYGQITNLADDTLSLRVDYNNGVAKLFNNYVFKLQRLTIAKGICSIQS